MRPETSHETRVLRLGSAALAAGVATYLALAYAHGGLPELAKLASLAGGSLFLFGKLVIFGGLKAGAPPIWSLALMTFLMDLVFAFALATGLLGLERSALLGGWLKKAHGRAREVLLEYPGLRRWAFFGVVAFVLLPIAGTGAITGSLVARLLGLSRLSGIGAIALASGWTAFAFALLAYLAGEQAENILKNPLIVAGVLGLAAVVGWAGYRRVLVELRRKG